jgi:hypothetical protein
MMLEDRDNYVRVTNGNKSFVGRFNGKDYKFDQGKPVDISLIAARHIFGFGLEDKTSALNRLGWARSSDELEAGLEKLAKVSFDDIPDLVEVPRRTGTAGPPVSAGGTKGGGLNPPPKGPRIGEAGGDAAA